MLVQQLYLVLNMSFQVLVYPLKSFFMNDSDSKENEYNVDVTG